MTTCKHCMEPVNPKASICPHCRKRLKTSLITRLVLALVVLPMAFGFFMAASDGPTTAATTPKDPVRDRNIMRTQAAVGQLKAAMRNPDSFKLNKVLLMANGDTCFDYRSQNGYSGMSSGRAILINDDIIIDNAKGFTAKWNKHCAGKSGEDIADGLSF